MAYNFSSTELRGGKLSLSDFKGKFVLVDFWASWCVPCRKGNPHLLDIYSKYKDKGFEIKNPNDITEFYNVGSLPTKILIGPDGKIIARYGGGGGSDADMDKKLAEKASGSLIPR